ncbi:MAG: site-specific integrase [Lachnospiraceae bacterium]|nr:site-specific integrase [Lachnospiraceae bacterium]
MWSEDLPNGKVRFVERYTDPMTGKQKKISVVLDKNTATTRKQAQAALADKISDRLGDLSAQTKNADLRLSDLVDLYRKSQSITVAKSTYSRNYHAANTIMQLLGKSTLVSQLNAAYVKDRFLAHGDSAGTFNERLTRFKALIRWGYENEYIEDIRYLDKIKPLNDKEKKEKLQNKFLEPEELKILLDAMTVIKWRYLSELTVLSGMRCGEAIALHMSDVDFKKKTIFITKTYDAVNKVITPPKTACSNREVYMQPELRDLCKKIRKYTLAGKLKYGYHTDLFLCDANGEHLDYYAYNKYLGEVSMRTLGRKITTHVMRHTHVSLMAGAGVPLDTITRRVGHENSDVTRDVYLHITERQKEREREQLDTVNIL